MKKIIFILSLFIVPFGSKAQCNFDNPVKLDSLGQSYKIFDWRDSIYTCFITKGSPSVGVVSPFASSSEILNVRSLRGSMDYQPNEGWEVVLKDFGTSTANNNPIPTLILYNRFDGMLRVFAYVKGTSDFKYQTAKIHIKFKKPVTEATNKESALLSHADSPVNAIDNFRKKISLSTPNDARLAGDFWLYADFPMAYDPCTCDHFTSLSITAAAINIVKVTLKAGDKETTIAEQSVADSGVKFNLDNLVKSVNTATSRGTAIGKSAGEVINIVNDVSKNFDKKTTTTLIYDIDPSNAPPLILDFLTTKAFRLPSWIKDASSGVGLALGLVEFFVGGGKSEPSVATILSNMSFQGQMTDSVGIHSFELYNPGSKWAAGTNNASKPIYNHTMGVFALLKTPMVKYRRFQQNVFVNQFNYDLYPPGQGQPYQRNYDTSSFAYTDRLDLKIDGLDAIDYAVNPASGLEISEIKAAIVIKLKPTALAQAPVFDKWGNPRNAYPPSQFRPPYSTFVHSTLSPINIFTEKVQGGNVVLQTPYLPLSCIKEYVAEIGYVGGQLGDVSDVRLQIVATLKRKDNPNAKPVLYVNQYKVNLVQDGSFPLTSDLSFIPIVASVNNLNLTKDVTIRAWDSVAVNGNIVTNGFKLTILSGREVTINNPSALQPNVEIKIESPTQCQPNKLPANSAELTSFCNNRYNSVVSTAVGEDEDVSSLKSQTTTTTSLTVAPNPFNNLLSVQYELQEPTQVTVSLSNALGQTVKVLVNQKVEAGSYQINESTADLPTGVYIVTMRTPTGMKTQKVVKQGN